LAKRRVYGFDGSGYHFGRAVTGGDVALLLALAATLSS
jgi:hypothetical protein